MKKDSIGDDAEEIFDSRAADLKKTKKAQSKAEREAIAHELEFYTQESFQAVNKRDWDYLNSPTNRIAPSFQMVYPSGMRPRADSKAQMIADFQALCKDSPDYQLHIVSLSTQVHDNVSCAEVFANCEVTGGPGVPVGMSRKTVSIFEFQRIDGVWMAVKDTTIPGGGEDRGMFGEVAERPY